MQTRMTMRTSGLLLWGLCALLAMTSSVQAQQGTSQRQTKRQSFLDRPRVSPYLSMVGGGTTGLNYYNIVRPQQQASKARRQLSNQLQSVRSQVQSLQRPQPSHVFSVNEEDVVNSGRMSPTGHSTTYSYVGTYYLNGMSQPR